MRLEGKTALVTGAGRGIGRGIAVAFAKQGANVVLASRSEAPLEAAAGEVEAAGARQLALVCDVSDPADVRGAVDRAVAEFGGVDILANVAQSWGPPGERRRDAPMIAPEELPDDWWDHTFATGARATFLCCKAVFPTMRERGGRILNFGSSVGINGGAGMADYAANKEAIRGLTRSLARAWGGYGITVNTICPAIETDAVAAMRESHPELIESTLRSRPIARFGDAEGDAGALAVFLASAEAGYLTGGTFMLDGGNTLL